MPMTEDDFNIWCRQLDFPDYTRQLIKQIRSSPPSRTVQGRFSNVCGTYSSFKMGVTIQFESHRGELAHIIDKLEHGLDVLEYYDQPPPIELIYLSKNGNLVRCSHTPDFFVIKHNWAGWEEFKTEDELIKQAQEKPNRYLLDEEGRWRCPPGEEYAQRYGLGYRLRSSEEINPIRLRNWIWLEPYFQAKGLSENFEINQEILSKVKAEPGITYAEILLEVEGIDPDDINILIVTERVYVNLDAAPLAEPHQVRVFLNQEIAKAYSRIALTSSSSSPVGGFYTLKVDVGTSFSWDGEYWEITNPGHESVHFKRADGKTTSLRNEEFYALFERGEITGLETQTESSSRPDVLKILLRARPEDIKVANQRDAFYIDEAHHLAMLSRGQRLKDQPEVLKSLANLANVKIVLAGTYNLLPLIDLGDQLCRRSKTIHFSRYQAEHKKEAKAFKSVLQTFQNHLPLPKMPDLVSHWEFLYERSLGNVGMLKDWLAETLSVVLEKNPEACTITLKDLNQQARPVPKCLTIIKEINKGEDKFKETSADLEKLRKALKLGQKSTQLEGIETNQADEQQKAATSKRKGGKVGQPKPRRYAVGGSEHDGE
jgi:hypothetical protein